jgi:dihydrofolate reductase
MVPGTRRHGGVHQRTDDFGILPASDAMFPKRSPRRDEMRVVISDFVSLDGVAQAPGGAEEDTEGGFAHGGWSGPFFDVDTMGAAVGESMSTTDALLFGRRTWQSMAAAWPARAGDPFADRMNEITKYVVSRTLTQDQLDWPNSTLLPAADVLGAVRRLRAQEGRDLQVMGSLTLARTLISHDLVDEYRLMIEPIMLGGGKRLFPDDGQARRLQLVASTTSSTGVHVCTYRPV